MLLGTADVDCRLLFEGDADPCRSSGDNEREELPREWASGLREDEIWLKESVGFPRPLPG